MKQIILDERIESYNESKKVTTEIAESEKTLYYWTNLQINYKKVILIQVVYIPTKTHSKTSCKKILNEKQTRSKKHKII